MTTPPARDRGIVLPRAALPYAMLQRPMIQRLTGLPRRLGIPRAFLLRAGTALFGRAIAREYVRAIRQDFEMILPHLPERADRILDIGCGLAFIDVLLYRHFASDEGPLINLLDRSSSDTLPAYGFSDRQEFYNSLDLSAEVLRRNGIPASDIKLFDAGAEDGFPAAPLDLVISIASWGFHYPVSTYLERVHSRLSHGGHLILDVRLGEGQETELRRAFGELVNLGPVWEGKAARYRAIKGCR